MYYAKDAKHINYVDKYSLKIVWSKNIDIPMVINIVPEIRNDYFAFDIPAIVHTELGKRSSIVNPPGFTNTTSIADTETGRILWKARVEGVNPIVTRTVLADNNMAFIKTAAGTVFVVKWANKGK
jgi:outer membrane protein assembly factor BamB